jgi:glutaredoxin
MNPLEKRVLSLFDELERNELDLHALFELAGGNPPAAREAVLDATTRMIERGWLRAAPGDYYARTEEGRLQLAGPLEVTLYTRDGCHLCEEAKRQIQPLLREFGATLREVNIDEDETLRAHYANDVPVIFLGSQKAAKHAVDPAQFRRRLARAAK